MKPGTKMFEVNGKKYLQVPDGDMQPLEACKHCCFKGNSKFVICSRPNDPVVKGCIEGKFHWETL